jgi:KUP system potassium uptake protein
LGGVLLAFTGVEVLFADLGAFSRKFVSASLHVFGLTKFRTRAIQISWLYFTYPCLLLAYIGQAAYISRDPSAYSNPFFNTVPPGMLLSEPCHLDPCCNCRIPSHDHQYISTAYPNHEVVLLSEYQNCTYICKVLWTDLYSYRQLAFGGRHGRGYSGVQQRVMFISIVIFSDSYFLFLQTTKLGNAYGVCVILVTFITTCMVSLVALIIWRLNPFLVGLFFLTFGLLKGTFLTSNLTKVPDGAWLTLALAAILSSTFMLWRYGKDRQWESERTHHIDLPQIVVK